MATLNLNLIQNSYSFVNEALSKAVLAEKDFRHWQFAVFALVQAIELTLKEKLRREHSALIFKNVDDRRQTVTIDQAASRLRELAKVSITETDLASIRTAVQWRNLIVHYEFDFSIDTLKPVFARLLGFLVDFNKAHLGEFLADHVSTELWKEAASIADYAAELFDRAKSRFKQEKIQSALIWVCPRCGYESFVIQDNLDTCYVCNFQEAVVACEHCDVSFFSHEVHQLITLNGRDEEVSTILCDACYEKEQRIQDDRFYDQDW
jgi:hypothetical protein